MKRKPRRRRSTISPITASTVRCLGRCPSVFHTEQNEQCFGQPRTVCTDAHMYLPGGISDQRAGLKSPPPTLPQSSVAHALDDRMRLTQRRRLVGIERRVNAAVDDVAAPLAHLLADTVAVDGITG